MAKTKLIKKDKTNITQFFKKAQVNKSVQKDHPVVDGYEKIVDQYIKLKEKRKEIESMMKHLSGQLVDKAVNYRIKEKTNGTIEFKGTTDEQYVQVQEPSKYTDKIIVDSEEQVTLKKLTNKNFDEWFELKRHVSLSDDVLKDEKRLEKFAKLISKEFGVEILEVNQYYYPKIEKQGRSKVDHFQSNRYGSNLTSQLQLQLNELLGVQNKVV